MKLGLNADLSDHNSEPFHDAVLGFLHQDNVVIRHLLCFVSFFINTVRKEGLEAHKTLALNQKATAK